MPLADLFDERRDRIVRFFRLIVEHKHAGTGDLDEFELRMFRDQSLPWIQKRRFRKAVRRFGQKFLVKSGNEGHDRNL